MPLDPEETPARRALITDGQAQAPAAAPEVVAVRSRRVACDGVGGALGHPRVWLEMGEEDFVECPYCDRRFVLAHGADGHENEELAPGVYEGAGGH
ncbi:zinc-finger domain-containing protein [Caulobacter sp. CCUG 60055]|uniref:zinc-finger domain-containing protein n=1 Tax=Caulobacter sp. CCUG 60055 TaxID=2100090 RepID=UPI001FA71BA5|nr:zinc-finger domain-containing protein [Caulobacter sp. CCUG 60055]MBQ1543142.1 zinc-finger domain-containing protein [Caulobacteraceae bacterium]MCI3179958.1 zinc-finger domain-containing protein [Caulobacter sp. CCUG 60055]